MEEEKTRWDVLFGTYQSLSDVLRRKARLRFARIRDGDGGIGPDDGLEQALRECGAIPYGSSMDDGAQEYEDYMAAQAALEALQEG